MVARSVAAVAVVSAALLRHPSPAACRLVSLVRHLDLGTLPMVAALPELGGAYDLAGQIDSGIAVYQRYLGPPDVVYCC